MTERQRRFVDEYILSGNGTQAARRSGYSEATASAAASKLLRKPAVSAAITKRLTELKRQAIAEQVEVLTFLTSVMRGDYAEETPTNGRVVAHSIPTPSRLRAAELLLKIYRAFDKPDEEEDDGKLVIEIVDAEQQV